MDVVRIHAHVLRQYLAPAVYERVHAHQLHVLPEPDTSVLLLFSWGQPRRPVLILIRSIVQEHMVENGHKRKVKNNVDEWLPITGDRHAKWWYAAFHNVTAMVGAGVLGLPNAMVYLTW